MAIAWGSHADSLSVRVTIPRCVCGVSLHAHSHPAHQQRRSWRLVWLLRVCAAVLVVSALSVLLCVLEKEPTYACKEVRDRCAGTGGTESRPRAACIPESLLGHLCALKQEEKRPCLRLEKRAYHCKEGHYYWISHFCKKRTGSGLKVRSRNEMLDFTF